jgi:hypothetical protein
MVRTLAPRVSTEHDGAGRDLHGQLGVGNAVARALNGRVMFEKSANRWGIYSWERRERSGGVGRGPP